MAKKNKRKYSSARDRVRQAAAQAGPGGGGGTMFQGIPQEIEYYNPEKGQVILRILPYVVSDSKHPDGDIAPEDSLWYKRPFKRFRQIGVEKKPYISPLSVSKPCPIFEYYKEAKADPGIPDKEADRAKPQDCVMYNVQIIDKKGKASDPMFFWMSYALFEKHLKVELNDPDNEEYLAFMDLEGGFDIKVRWEEESFAGNKYLEAGRISFVERDEDIGEDILDGLVDLDNVLVIKSYKELQNIFLEIDDDDAGEKEEEETPEPAKKPARKKTAKPEPEPEPEPEPDEALLSADELLEMSVKEMKRFIKTESLGIKPAKMDEDDLREAIADELGFSLPESDKDDDKKGGGDTGNKCPHGHTFGTDCDEKKDCDACKVWDECMEAQEEADN